MRIEAAPVGELNAMRKHLSALKGGGALRRTRGRILAFLLSDVPDDDPSAIGSGPFAADPTSFAEALSAVQPLPEVPERVTRHLEAGARGEIPDTRRVGHNLLPMKYSTSGRMSARSRRSRSEGMRN